MEERFFDIHEKIDCVHSEVWSLFEELLKMKKQVDGLLKSSKRRPSRSRARKSGRRR